MLHLPLNAGSYRDFRGFLSQSDNDIASMLSASENLIGIANDFIIESAE